MSKYDSLWKYIEGKNSNQVKMSFEEIKKVLSFEIDHSFLNYKKELIQYGYKVEKISLKEKYIIFSKIE